MSEKRFTIHKESKYKEEWCAYPFCIKEDGEMVLETIPLSIAEKVRDKLNDQQSNLKELEKNFDDIVEWASEISKRNVILDEQIGQLQRENEQLKEELQRFKKYVFSEDNILCYKCEHCIKKDIYVVDCEMKGEVDVHGLCGWFREDKV